MATFIPQIQANIPDLEMYDPNFELINNWLETKQSRYDQGRIEVSKAYQTIQNLPLTDEMNITKKNQFLKDAENEIKRLSSVDLSLEENVRAARQIFNPLLKDEDILTDATFTSKATALAQTNQRFKNSSDEDDRARYNPGNDAYASLKLEEFKNADAETRKKMAGQDLSFVDNVNLFDSYLEITKNMDFEIDFTSSPTGANGALSPFLITQKNGKEIEPLAYVRLSRLFNNDPTIQAYYDQQGYIQTRSQVQSLANTVGYDLAVETVTQQYQMEDEMFQAEKAKQVLLLEKNILAEEEKLQKAKLKEGGIIPGSEEHKKYLELTQKTKILKAEYQVIVDQINKAGQGITSIEDVYRSVGRQMYNSDLSAASDDYAIRKSSIDYKATPNYSDLIEARQNDEATEESLYSPADDTAPITYTPEDFEQSTFKSNEKDLLKKQNEVNNDFVGVISSYTREWNKSNKDQKNEVKFPNTGITDATTAQAWYNRVSGSSTKAQEIAAVEAQLKQLDESGVLAELYPETQAAYDSWKLSKEAYVNGEIKAAGSYKDSFINTKEALKLSSETAAFAPLVDLVYNESTGIRSLKDFTSLALNAYRNGTLPAELNDVFRPRNIRPSFNDQIDIAKELAVSDYQSSLEESQRTLPLLDENGNEVGRKLAWENLPSSEKIARINEVYGTGAQTDRAYIAAKKRLYEDSPLKEIYENIIGRAEEYYKQDPDSESVTSLLNPNVTTLDGGSDAIEQLSVNINIVPNANAKSRKGALDQEVLVNSINKALEGDQAFIFTQAFTPQLVEDIKDEDYKAANGGKPSYRMFRSFKQALTAKNQAKTASSPSDPRATFKILSAVDLGDGKSGSFVEVTYNTAWARTEMSTSENPGTKQVADSSLEVATIFIPDTVAGSMNLPVSEDVKTYKDFLINEEFKFKSPNGGLATITYDPDNKVMEVTQEVKTFDPITGKYRTEVRKDNNLYEANALSYKYLTMQIRSNMLSIAQQQKQLENQYKQENGAVYSDDELN